MSDKQPNVDLAIYEVPVTALRSFPGNPRISDVEALSRSLEVNGQYRPIVVRRETREILAGNHTWKAAQKLGWPTIKVTYVEGLTDAQAKRIVLADNRYSDLASYSVPDLTTMLESLPSLEGTGYDQYTASNLLNSFSDEKLTPEKTSGILAGDEGSKPIKTLTCPNCQHSWEG